MKVRKKKRKKSIVKFWTHLNGALITGPVVGLIQFKFCIDFAFELVNLYVWDQFEQSLIGVVLLFDHYKCCESMFLVTSA